MVVDDDRYGNIMDDMRGIGFRPDAEIGNRLAREVKVTAARFMFAEPQ